MTALKAPSALTAHRQTVRQLTTFCAIGVVSTVAYAALYAELRRLAPAAVANAAALLITALANTAANRHMTFGLRGRRGLFRDHAAGLAALGVALALTSTSLAILGLVAPSHSRAAEVAVLVAANAAATVVRFVLLRIALIRRSRGRRAGLAADRSEDARRPAAHGFPFIALSPSERTRG